MYNALLTITCFKSCFLQRKCFKKTITTVKDSDEEAALAACKQL